jgi:hypothetical protein
VDAALKRLPLKQQEERRKKLEQLKANQAARQQAQKA